ncbi:hypothetical protein TIFTF001_019195 [Ficus carica]|uniref:Uncharacterized protein n=1 Tax=Ficus carica TaxID=3494 RepID=A0AA88DBI3_FICCA|nr:hypothetical protein TIFTF001_019195 [Ficus carica]
MAVLFAAKPLQYTFTKNNDSIPFQNPLFLVAFSVPCTHLLLNRHGCPQNRIFYSPSSLRRRRLALPFPSHPGLRPCLAAKPGHPPPPPQSDPPPEPPQLAGTQLVFSSSIS